MPRVTTLLRAGLAAVVVIAAAAPVEAAVGLAAVFADHMVLQREMPVPIWGTAPPGATVEVSFAGAVVHTVTGADGRWHATLGPLTASVRGERLTVAAAEERVEIADVVVGEVWLLGGQSNMEYTAGAMAARLPAGQDLVAAADLPDVRFCRIAAPAAAEPRADFGTAQRWDVCTPAAVAGHSAVGFVFARRLHASLGVPVGVIDTSVGGTPIEPHVPVSAFVGHPTLEAIAARARAGDVAGIRALPGGTLVRGDHWLPGRLWNGRIAPLVPLAVRGAAWYQGESNCGAGEDPRDYAAKLGALVAGWRAAWQRPDLPVYVVQLPQWRSPAWPFLREEQRRATASLAHSGLVVTIDLDHADDIHPPAKIAVGERLARWPLARLHGRELVCTGPTFRAVERRDGVLVVTFDHAAGGLMAGRALPAGTVEDTGSEEVHGFEVCDPQGAWHEAGARIADGAVVVTAAAVAEPVAVRYACRPRAPREKPWNLHGRTGLPAGPFCSDFTRMPYRPEDNPP